MLYSSRKQIGFENQVTMVKFAASAITIIRIICAVLMLFFVPFSPPFFVLYALCCVSDVLDGFVARKTNTESKLGETLDSISDFVFIAVMLTILIPLISWEGWMLWWIAAIALLRFSSLGIGFAKFHALTFLHTYSNKVTGIALSFFPVLYYSLGLSAIVIILCSIAGLSAIEELIIAIRARKLDRNTISMFHINKT